MYIYIYTHTHIYICIFIFRGQCFHGLQKCHCQAITADYERPYCCAVTGESARLCQWMVLLPLDSLSIVFCTSFLHLELPGCMHFLSQLPYDVELLLDAGFGLVERKEQEGSISCPWMKSEHPKSCCWCGKRQVLVSFAELVASVFHIMGSYLTEVGLWDCRGSVGLQWRWGWLWWTQDRQNEWSSPAGVTLSSVLEKMRK